MPDPNLPTKCEDWASFRFADYTLSNNVWNKGAVKGYEQCVRHGAPRGLYRSGWTWDWPDTGNAHVRAYPEIIFGWKPWDDIPTTAKLPKPLSALAGVTATYRIAVAGTGAFNTTFDLWLIPDAAPVKDPATGQPRISTEVMVWVANQDLRPAGTVIDTVPATFGTLTLYREAFPNWTYYAFVLDAPLYEGRIELNDLLQYLIAGGHVSPNEHLASVEFGTEIAFGKGAADLIEYEVRVT